MSCGWLPRVRPESHTPDDIQQDTSEMKFELSREFSRVVSDLDIGAYEAIAKSDINQKNKALELRLSKNPNRRNDEPRALRRARPCL